MYGQSERVARQRAVGSAHQAEDRIAARRVAGDREHVAVVRGHHDRASGRASMRAQRRARPRPRTRWCRAARGARCPRGGRGRCGPPSTISKKPVGLARQDVDARAAGHLGERRLARRGRARGRASHCMCEGSNRPSTRGVRRGIERARARRVPDAGRRSACARATPRSGRGRRAASPCCRVLRIRAVARQERRATAAEHDLEAVARRARPAGARCRGSPAARAAGGQCGIGLPVAIWRRARSSAAGVACVIRVVVTMPVARPRASASSSRVATRAPLDRRGIAARHALVDAERRRRASSRRRPSRSWCPRSRAPGHPCCRSSARATWGSVSKASTFSSPGSPRSWPCEDARGGDGGDRPCRRRRTGSRCGRAARAPAARPRPALRPDLQRTTDRPCARRGRLGTPRRRRCRSGEPLDPGARRAALAHDSCRCCSHFWPCSRVSWCSVARWNHVLASPFFFWL